MEEELKPDCATNTEQDNEELKPDYPTDSTEKEKESDMNAASEVTGHTLLASPDTISPSSTKDLSAEPTNTDIQPVASPSLSGHGGYSYKLVKQHKSSKYHCPICHLIIREPALVDCCGHHFCNTCITSHSKQPHSKCPLCREKFKWQINRNFECKVNSLQVYCVNRENGCAWTRELRHVEEHIANKGGTGVKKCEFQVTNCDKCDKELLHGELSHHMNSVCEHRIIHCDYSFTGCDFKCSKLNMPTHLQDDTSRHLLLVTKLMRKKEEPTLSPWHYWWILLALFMIILAIPMFYSTCSTLCSTQIKNTTIDLEERLDKHIRLAVENTIEALRHDIDVRLAHQEETCSTLCRTQIKNKTIERLDKQIKLAVESAIETLRHDIDVKIAHEEEKTKKLDEMTEDTMLLQENKMKKLDLKLLDQKDAMNKLYLKLLNQERMELLDQKEIKELQTSLVNQENRIKKLENTRNWM